MLGEWMNKENPDKNFEVTLGDVSIMGITEMQDKVKYLYFKAKAEFLNYKAHKFTRNAGQAKYHRGNANLFAEHHNRLAKRVKQLKSLKKESQNITARKQILG